MIIGTSHFYDLESAVMYYDRYGYSNALAAVKRKLNDGEISLGKPKLKKKKRRTAQPNRWRTPLCDYNRVKAIRDFLFSV